MKRVKKARKRILSVVLTTTLLVGISGFPSRAAEIGGMEDVLDANEKVEVLEATVVEEIDLSSEVTPYTMLADCIITVGEESDGMHISISTGSVGTASVLGVKDVKIYKKNGRGNWELVAISSGGESKNCTMMGISIIYGNAVKGATYKITCIHYGNVDGYIEGENDSGAFVYDFK